MKLIIAAVFGVVLLGGCASLADSTTTTRPTATTRAAATSGMTRAQENAVESAESYLRSAGFSKAGLIGQLEYEKYTTGDATKAVNSLTVDWNAEAAESAESYLNSSSFSCQGLIDQLVYEKYTTAQAQHGAGTTGIC